MSTLADKIRAARQIEIKVGGITFTGRRATNEEFSDYYRNDVSLAEVARRHINGWAGVKESDLIPGGSDDGVKFERDLFNEVIADQQDWWMPIYQEIIRDAIERAEQKAESKKK